MLLAFVSLPFDIGAFQVLYRMKNHFLTFFLLYTGRSAFRTSLQTEKLTPGQVNAEKQILCPNVRTLQNAE